MLSTIKNKTKGPITIIIVGLISLTFIITALYGVDFNSSGAVVASVDGEEVSEKDFLLEFNPKKRQLQQELGEKYTAEFDRVLKQSTIESIINRRPFKSACHSDGACNNRPRITSADSI